MDGFVPYEAPTERERSRTRNDKHIVVDDDEANKGCFSENLLGDYFNGEPIDLDEVLGSNLPTAEGGSDKGPELTKASRLVNGEARMAQFMADKADKEIARMREELECSRRCEGELVTREISRAYRRGKREMAEWEPIPVSPDTVEAETGAADETGEVNQPTVSLDVDDYSMGGSMTGYYEFDG
ncbi:hypothetical protein DY000_02013583 [Brassica cretica]|nr:hypothetical protein DY000_02013583 [Brassica cretica]